MSPCACPATIDDLCNHAQAWANGYYANSREYLNVRDALKALRELAGYDSPANIRAELLCDCQNWMVGQGLSRQTINDRIRRIKTVLRWSAKPPRRWVSAEILTDVELVDPLKENRSPAPEGPGRSPVAWELVEATMNAAPPWLGDEVYGSDGKLRRFLDVRGQPYVLAVSGQQRLWQDFEQQRVDAIARSIPGSSWLRLSVADGSKGPRVYDWAAGQFGIATEHGLMHWLLIRRGLDDPDEQAYYLCAAPPQANAHDLAIAAGQRWSIECCFESAKQETGLDNYEVRSWHGWRRHVTLSMLALALLAAIRAAADPDAKPIQKRRCVVWSH